MLGAIIGDIVGSVHEYEKMKSKEFPLFTKRSQFTDDTVMTIAVAEALLNGGTADNFIDSMKKFGRLYPDAGYGGQFRQWVLSDDRRPYSSFGNGAAMRVSPCAWFAKSLEEAERLAELSASVTHNHPEGIKGAKATAVAIYLARTERGSEKTKEDIKDYVQSKYGYCLGRTLNEIRPGYQFNETCQETVPEAIIAFLESKNFESAIRNAVSLGGDADTLAAIAGSIAEGEYGIGHDTLTKMFRHLDDNLSAVINAWLDRGLPTGGDMFTKPVRLQNEPKEFSKPHKIKTDFRVSENQLARIRFGLRARQMEDKWFIYFEDGGICCHRSWAGYKIYEAEVQKCDSGYIIPELAVERDAELYGCPDDSEDIRQFHYLIGCGLLDLNLDSIVGNSDTDLLRWWGQFGKMMLTHKEKKHRDMPKRPKSREHETWRVISFLGLAEGDLDVERRKSKGAFQFRLSYTNSRGHLKHSKWFPDLELALASSRREWWLGSMPSVMPVAPYLLEELRRILKTSPAVKFYVEDHPDGKYKIKRFEERIEGLIKDKESLEHSCSLRELRWAWAPEPVPVHRLWSESDEALGMTEDDKQTVIAARQEDWDYNGKGGYEPPRAKTILSMYRHLRSDKMELKTGSGSIVGGHIVPTAEKKLEMSLWFLESHPNNQETAILFKKLYGFDIVATDKISSEPETVIVLRGKDRSLAIQRMGEGGAFKYRIHVYGSPVDEKKRSNWLSDLEQTLNSSGYEWWRYNPIEVELDLEDELLRIAESFPDFCCAVQKTVNREKVKIAADWLKLAKDHAKHGKIVDAITKYTRAIELNSNPMAYRGRGSALQDIGELDRAIADYDMAIKCGGNEDPTLFFGRAGAYHKKGELDSAIADYSAAIKLDTDTTALPLINRGNVYIDMCDYISGIADYTEAIRLGCNAANGNAYIAKAHHNRGLAYIALEDSDSAIADFTQSIWLDPSKPEPFLDRGNAYYDVDDYDRAVSDYTHAIQLVPSHPKAYHNRGCVYAEKGDFDKALADFGEAIRLMPTDASVHLHQGMAHREMGNHDLAIVSLGKAIELDPNLGMAWHNRGLAYQEIGDTASASSDLAMASKLGYYSKP